MSCEIDVDIIACLQKWSCCVREIKVKWRRSSPTDSCCITCPKICRRNFGLTILSISLNERSCNLVFTTLEVHLFNALLKVSIQRNSDCPILIIIKISLICFIRSAVIFEFNANTLITLGNLNDNLIPIRVVCSNIGTCRVIPIHEPPSRTIVIFSVHVNRFSTCIVINSSIIIFHIIGRRTQVEFGSGSCSNC